MEREIRYRFEEIVRICGVSERRLRHFVEAGWVRPLSKDPEEFDQEDQARIELIAELQEIFEVNDEAVPLLLHLIDQIHHLRARLQSPGDLHGRGARRRA